MALTFLLNVSGIRSRCQMGRVGGAMFNVLAHIIFNMGVSCLCNLARVNKPSKRTWCDCFIYTTRRNLRQLETFISK